MRNSEHRAVPCLALIGALVASAALTGCAASKTAKGAVIGGAAGAGVGGLAGGKKGAVIGGAVGAVAGGVIGHYMDEQEKKLQTVEGAKVEREGDMLKVTFDSAILFDSDKADLKDASRANLAKVAAVLKEYPETNLLIEGHTDSQNTETYNQKLSERRAGAVESFLIEQGVAASRLKSKGYGEMTPVASNETAEGRAQNRRVEVKIEANEDLKAKAAEQEKQG
jgi:outer membrane protein OmpA-like peptidoglycan-associated protein